MTEPQPPVVNGLQDRKSVARKLVGTSGNAIATGRIAREMGCAHVLVCLPGDTLESVIKRATYYDGPVALAMADPTDESVAWVRWETRL